MSEYLPGNLQERLRELREENGFSTRQELAEILKIDKSTYGRIESGATKTINNDLLCALADLYNVSTDYILGRTDNPRRMDFDLKDLGISTSAAENLLTKKADPVVVNELLQNDKFLSLTRGLYGYFSDVAAYALITNNNMCNFSLNVVSELSREGKIPKDRDVDSLKKTLNAQKIPSESVQITKFVNLFKASLSEIKRKTSGEIRSFSEESFSSEMLEEFKRQLSVNDDMANTTEEEKRNFVVNVVKAGITYEPGTTPEEIKAVEEAIEKSIDIQIELWKKIKK